MNSYQVGDKVRVREDLQEGETYYMSGKTMGDIFVDDMERLKGKVVTIVKSTRNGYEIKEDKRAWYWVDEMFDSNLNRSGR